MNGAPRRAPRRRVGSSEVAHRQSDRRLRSVLHQIQGAHRVADARGTHGDLHDVGVLFAHGGVNQFEVGGHLAHVVITDDALDASEARDLVGDIVFEIDPVEAGDDGLTQQRMASVFTAVPLAPVGGAADGGEDGAGPIFEKAFEVGRLAR